MRVLHIAAWWPSQLHPRHGNFIQKHVRTVALVHECVVATVQEDAGLRPWQQRQAIVREQGYTVIQTYYGTLGAGSKLVKLLLRGCAYGRSARTAMKQLSRPPQLIHGHIVLDGGVVAAGLAHLLNVPVVVSEHATHWTSARPQSDVKLFLARWTAKRAKALMPVSTDLARAMQKHGVVGSYRTVSNVVDTRLFSPAGDRSAEIGRLRLLHVSNFLDRQKNISGLLRCYGRLVRDHPDSFHLELAGDGDQETVSSLVEHYRLPVASFQISGPHSEEAIALKMRSVDALVLFSNYETQGVVLLEAQSCGLPCIATHVAGATEVIEEGKSGYLIPPRDEQALYAAIVKLKTNKEHFDSSYIRRRITDICSEATIRRLLGHVYTAAAED